MFFRGRERHSVDAKGRTSLPARFRDVLDEHLPAKKAGQLVIVPWFGECARIYPVDLWNQKVEAFEAQADESDVFDADEDIADLRRLIYGAALDVTLDAHGRFVLPRYLREDLGIEKEVFCVGTGRFLELWSPEALQARFSGARASALRNSLSKLGRKRVQPEDTQQAPAQEQEA